jgi:VanZ family protein
MRLALWLLVLAYLAAIFYLSSQPNPLPILTSALSDKALHALEYGGLGFLLALALRAMGMGLWRSAAVALAAASLYGASDEIHQGLVPHRDASVRDWIADTAGAALGAAGAAALLRRRWRAPGSG